jgi:hypothetical protein
MRKVLFAIAFFLFLLGGVSCKRDYPRNIPHWLKDKIKELKKESKRKGGCGLGECMSIHEFSDGANVFYVWRVGTEYPSGDIFYDYDGNFLCEQFNFLSGSCGSIADLSTYYYTRDIWLESNY